MIRKLALVVAAVASTLAVGTAAEAAPSAAISCRTDVTFSGNTTNIRVISNHPDPHRVHSYKVYQRTVFTFHNRTYAPYGPTLSLSNRYYLVRSWQSGTECRRWTDPRNPLPF